MEDKLPSLHHLYLFRKKTDQLFKIYEHELGVYLDFEKKLQSILIPMLKQKNKKLRLDRLGTIKIKICADGFKVGNNEN